MADLEGHVQFQPTATWVAVEVIDSRFVPRNSSSPFAPDRPARFEGNQPGEYFSDSPKPPSATPGGSHAPNRVIPVAAWLGFLERYRELFKPHSLVDQEGVLGALPTSQEVEVTLSGPAMHTGPLTHNW
jgi:hypothetical protein